MPGTKGLEWNKVQLKIAYCVQAGLTAKQIQEQTGIALPTVYKVKAHLEDGDDPGKVTPEMIDAAKDPAQFGEHGLPPPPPAPPKAPTGDGSDPDKKPDAEKPKGNPDAGKPKTTSVSQTTFLKFIAQTQQIAMTPRIFTSYFCALKKGFEGQLGDWLEYVSEDFWTGRGYNPYQEVVGFDTKVPDAKEEVPVGQQAG